MKCTTRTAAAARYGHIDFASRHWPDQGKWLKLLEIPHDWFPGWKVQGTKMQTTHIACNLDLHAPLLTALTHVHERKLGKELLSFDGCFNIRMVRGSTSHFSAHSYGLAVDLNASRNPMGQVLHSSWSKEFVACFKEQGFDWGGDWHGRKDPMHFSFCWE